MRRLFVLVATLGGLCLGGAAAAQTAPPGTLPVTPDPTECGIAPRAAEELADLPSATAVSESLAPFLFPIGPPADQATVAFATATVREALACGNAHGFLGAAALVSNASLAQEFVAGAGGEGVEILTFRAEAAVPEQAERRTLLGVLAARSLGDGRVGAVVAIDDPTQTPAATLVYLVLAEHADGAGDSGQYLFLIDEIITDPYHFADGA